MPISRRHRFIFVQINKTGSSAVHQRLEALAPDLDEMGHRILSAFDVPLDDYFKFSFVRNPWDKIVSFYAYHRRRGYDLLPAGRLQEHDAAERSFRQFVLEDMHLLEFPNPKGASSRLMRASNQLDWLTDRQGRVAMDFIGRYETLQRDFDEVCRRLGFPATPLARVNASRHAHYTSYYDDETREAIAQAFRKDIDYFGYRFGD